MKTKLKPKARKMWANYYPHCPIPSIFDSKVRAISSKKSYPATVMTIPVAVIPLDDPDALIRAAANAYFSSLERNTEDSWRDTLAAIGVLPRKRNPQKTHTSIL